MSRKSKKQKAKFFGPGVAPMVYPGPSQGFDYLEYERRAEREAARHEELRYRIAPDCKVHIRFDGIATQEAIKKLMHYLEMGIGDFPENADDLRTQE